MRANLIVILASLIAAAGFALASLGDRARWTWRRRNTARPQLSDWGDLGTEFWIGAFALVVLSVLFFLFQRSMVSRPG